MHSDITDGPEPLRTDHFHSRIYKFMLALVALYVLAAWYGFGDSAYPDYLLAIVTGFMAMAVALPLIAARVWRHHPPPQRMPGAPGREDFLDWRHREMGVDTGTMTGGKAAVEALLPLGAVAFGMLIFAILAHVMR